MKEFHNITLIIWLMTNITHLLNITLLIIMFYCSPFTMTIYYTLVYNKFHIQYLSYIWKTIIIISSILYNGTFITFLLLGCFSVIFIQPLLYLCNYRKIAVDILRENPLLVDHINSFIVIQHSKKRITKIDGNELRKLYGQGGFSRVAIYGRNEEYYIKIPIKDSSVDLPEMDKICLPSLTFVVYVPELLNGYVYTKKEIQYIRQQLKLIKDVQTIIVEYL